MPSSSGFGSPAFCFGSSGLLASVDFFLRADLGTIYLEPRCSSGKRLLLLNRGCAWLRAWLRSPASAPRTTDHERPAPLWPLTNTPLRPQTTMLNKPQHSQTVLPEVPFLRSHAALANGTSDSPAVLKSSLACFSKAESSFLRAARAWILG